MGGPRKIRAREPAARPGNVADLEMKRICLRSPNIAPKPPPRSASRLKICIAGWMNLRASRPRWIAIAVVSITKFVSQMFDHTRKLFSKLALLFVRLALFFWVLRAHALPDK